MDKIVLFKFKNYMMVAVAVLFALVLGVRAINIEIERSEIINGYKALYLDVTAKFDEIYIDPIETYDREEILKIMNDLDLNNETTADDIQRLHDYIVEISNVSYIRRSRWSRKYGPILDSYYSLESLSQLLNKYKKPVDYNDWVEDSNKLRESFLKIEISRFNFGNKQLK